MAWLIEMGVSLARRSQSADTSTSPVPTSTTSKPTSTSHSFRPRANPRMVPQDDRRGYRDQDRNRGVRQGRHRRPAVRLRLGVVTIPDEAWGECVVVSEQGIDLVASYRNFYVFKAKRKFVMKWLGSLEPRGSLTASLTPSSHPSPS